MADYGWRNDNHRWDDQRGRNQGGRYGYGGNNGDEWRGQSSQQDHNRQQDFGRESDYGAGYASPRNFDDMNQRPGGMRDQNWGRGQGGGQNWGRDQNWNRDQDDWNQGWSRSGQAGRGFGGYGSQRGNGPDYAGSYGYGPSDYQDYGDWQGQGSIGYGTMGAYGGPRFGNGYSGNRDTYGRGYGNYGGGNYSGGGNYGGSYGNRGYSSYGRDQGDDRWNNRNFWNKATDEVASWAGDDEAGRRREMDRMHNHAGRGPKGYTRSDDRIREDVNDRLTDDWQLDATNIDVTVNNGEVTLAGTVDDIEDKHRAERIIENLSGVKHVQNNLRVDTSSRSGTSAGQSSSIPVGSSGTGTSYSSASRSSTSSGTSSSPSTQPGNNGSTAH